MTKEGSLTKTHIFYGTCLGFIFGILLGSIDLLYYAMNEHVVFGLFLSGIVLLFFVKSNKFLKITVYTVIFVFLGIWHYIIASPLVDANHISFYNGRSMEISGVVVGDVMEREKNLRFYFLADEKKGKVMVYANVYADVGYGDRLKIICDLVKPEPFEGFYFDRYLARHGAYSVCYYPQIEKIGENKNLSLLLKIKSFKTWSSDKISVNMSQDSAQVARAMLLGEAATMDEELRTDFSLSGISHIVAISGLHIGIIAAIIVFVFLKIGFSRNFIFYAVLVLLAIYIVMVGMPASALRAGLMVALFLYALKIGRISNIDRILIFAACVLLFFNPYLLRDDIGFQLSFLCVLGIVYLHEPVKRMLNYLQVSNKLKINELLNVTLSAQIASLGIASYYFGVIPIFGIVANILVVSLCPFLLGFLFFALIFSFLGQMVFWPAQVMIDYIINVSYLVSALPGSHLNFKFNLTALMGYYLLLCGFLFYFYMNEKNKIRLD